MTTETISSTAAIVLSLLFSYFPWLSDWYARQDSQAKRLVMLAALFVVVAGAYTLSCFGQASHYTCDQPGVWMAVRGFIAALIANQATFLITPKPAA